LQPAASSYPKSDASLSLTHSLPTVFEAFSWLADVTGNPELSHTPHLNTWSN